MRRARLIGAALGAVLALIILAGAYALIGPGSGSDPGAGATTSEAPVRVGADTAGEDERAGTDPATTVTRPRARIVRSRTEGAAPPAPTTTTAPAPAPVETRPRARRPVVWVQAGHTEPREPGYRAQSGAGSGPFGSEVAFTTELTAKVVDLLTEAGVDARPVAGQVDPIGAEGAAFVSLHHDSPGGAAAFGHAITGAGENYYRGEGSGDPSPTPYPDSAPHRPATTVTGPVERDSRALAEALDAAFRPIYTPANGARGRYGGVQTRTGNPRMMRYYGFYRTNARARVIVEAGAAGADDAFLARTDLIAGAVTKGVVAHLRETGRLD